MWNCLVPEIGQGSARDHNGDELCDEPCNIEAASEN